jgi:hypothetical protein
MVMADELNFRGKVAVIEEAVLSTIVIVLLSIVSELILSMPVPVMVIFEETIAESAGDICAIVTCGQLIS